jgi:acetamidase/formamidase
MRTLHHRDGHHGWDRDRPPLLEVDPGTTLELILADAFGGQLGPDASGAAVAALDLDLANPLTGPIAVRGARPGDALVVEVLDVTVGEVGWTTLIPGFGLLADRFPDPYALVSTIADGRVHVAGFAELPARPFLGTVGVVSAEPGSHSVIPPRRVGGNLDCREVRPGARLLLPVEVDGARLSAGDPHAAQATVRCAGRRSRPPRPPPCVSGSGRAVPRRRRCSSCRPRPRLRSGRGCSPPESGPTCSSAPGTPRWR